MNNKNRRGTIIAGEQQRGGKASQTKWKIKYDADEDKPKNQQKTETRKWEEIVCELRHVPWSTHLPGEEPYYPGDENDQRDDDIELYNDMMQPKEGEQPDEDRGDSKQLAQIAQTLLHQNILKRGR